VESQRQRAHVIRTGTDVLFTVNGCVAPVWAARWLKQFRRRAWRVLTQRTRAVRRIHESEDLLSLSGALLAEHTGRCVCCATHAACENPAHRQSRV
jgi:hypothetical protein